MTKTTIEAITVVGLAAVLFGGCVSYDEVDAIDASAEGLIPAGSLEEYGMLRFLNGPEATLSILDDAMALDSRAATNIFNHVNGPDGLLHTADDDPIGSIYELDAISWVGPATMDQMLLWLYDNDRIPSMTIEGVNLTEGEAADMVLIANTATTDELDIDAALDSRAVQAIIAARNIATINALAAVPYVGTVAMGKLRTYVSY